MVYSQRIKPCTYSSQKSGYIASGRPLWFEAERTFVVPEVGGGAGRNGEFVDDQTAVSKSAEKIKWLKTDLAKAFNIRDFGPTRFHCHI